MTKRMKCTAPGCSGGTTMVGFSIGICAICGGTGTVTKLERLDGVRPGDCPYGACGGACGGKGYYMYRGSVRIDCSNGGR